MLYTKNFLRFYEQIEHNLPNIFIEIIVIFLRIQNAVTNVEWEHLHH